MNKMRGNMTQDDIYPSVGCLSRRNRNEPHRNARRDLEREAVPTRKALAQVPERKDGWKPHQKSMKLGDLASLCATMPTWIAMMINQDELRISSKGGGEDFPSKKLETRKQWLAALDESVATAKKALEGTTVDHLKKSWTFVLDEAPVLTQPRHVAIRDSNTTRRIKAGSSRSTSATDEKSRLLRSVGRRGCRKALGRRITGGLAPSRRQNSSMDRTR